MPQFSVDLQVLRDALLDRSLSQVGDTLLRTSITNPTSLGEIALTPSTQINVRVLNRPEDRDDDAIFNGGATPHITFDMQSAWVKYKLTVGVDAAMKLPVIALKAGGEIALADYRIHRPTDAAFSAMTHDLASPRTLLQLDDVQRLAPGEALTMEIGGSMSASIDLSWSDILGTKVLELFDELPVRLPIAVTLKTGLSATARLRVTDDFSVVISRTTDNRYRIAVKKARSKDHTFGIEVTAGLDASASEAVQDALAPTFDALTQKAEMHPQKDVVLAGIAEIKSKLNSKLDALLRWKAMTGFAYEYARIDENTAIADYILLDESKLADDYTRAISGDFASIAQSLREDVSARALVRYLNETTMTRRWSSGFSLGIGKWLDVAAREQSTFTESTRTSLDGFQLVTCRGTHKYDEKNIPQNDFEWVVDLKAQMTEFRSSPTSSDLDYGLQYAITLDRAVIHEVDIARMIDLGAMWDVCAPDASTFDGALGRKGTLRVQVLFDREPLAKTLAAFGASWADALAAAMPYMSNFDERRTFERRIEVYTDAWTAWLRDGSRTNLRTKIHSALMRIEDQSQPGSFGWVVGEGHPHLRERLNAFIRGAQLLRDAMANARDVDAIANAYASLEQFWSQRLYVAASGRYLMQCAKVAGVTPNVSLQVEYADTTITS